MLLDQQLRFQMVELKYTRTNAVRISPHQVSFLSSHAAALAWLLVKKDPSRGESALFLYRGKDVMGVAVKGLLEEPFAKVSKMEEVIELIGDA